MSCIKKTGRKLSEQAGKNMWRYISILMENQDVGADCVFGGADNRDIVIVEVMDERNKTGGFGKIGKHFCLPSAVLQLLIKVTSSNPFLFYDS